jgi:pepF/M3 family oligoendopeptidase
MKGFASPLDATLFYARMDRATLDAMIGAIEERLDVFRGYLKAKAALLGKQSLPFYDMFAPVGGVNRRFTLDEARDFLMNAFAGFDPELSAFIGRAFEQRWLDTEPREGKQGGAFCDSIHAIGESRILSNFDGSYGEVLTLAHELGHAWHHQCILEQSILNSDYPMQLAETASTFNELFVNGESAQKAEGEELLGLLDADLDNATQVCVDILSRYYFETEVFRRRKDGALSVEEFKEIMLDAQRRAYGDGLDADALHPYMWLCKGHYYGQPDFYNWPYAFGLLFAVGLYGLFRQRGQAFAADYRRLLAMTGSAGTAEVAATAGVDVRDRAFWHGSIDVIEQKVRRFAELAQGAKA